jgi:hypothetical protein
MTSPVDEIIAHHRTRRFAMKVQQKIDRALESYVRISYTEWTPDSDEAARKKNNDQVLAIIKAARNGEGESGLIDLVRATDESREPWDNVRSVAEKSMEQLAGQLPIYSWVESIRGAGALGLATILAEAGGPLDRFATHDKLWKRLGFAPYDGLAGSSWKRETWRPRKLSKEEWIANPFSGERYGMMRQIATWLVNAQWIGAKKDPEGEGKPNGPYGEVYAKRRARTMITHADWSKGHRRSDALRVAMKVFLRDLWREWNGGAVVVPIKRRRDAA